MTSATRNSSGLPAILTRAFESIGLLTKGTAAVATGEAGAEQTPAAVSPVKAPALNVTRVTGVSALIASAGGAALALYGVDKDKDPASTVAAAYGSSGLIVASALIAVAVIVVADIRARSSVAASAAAVGAPTATRQTGTKADLKSAWSSAIDMLHAVEDALPANGTRVQYSKLWLNARASTGFSDDLQPPDELRDEHAKLLAGQERICDLLKTMTDDQAHESAVGAEVRAIVTEMRSTLAGIQ